MKPICQKCGTRGPDVSCDTVSYKCLYCSTKQKYKCSCELCTQEMAIVKEVVEEEEFIDGIIEFKQDFELED